ncbi:MAG TPA: FHA domain-containing protein [Nostocaceae cyanobacterium]|nr:FHA domain-containing protein [Nostocaceae cyanobacterium]
MNSLTLHWQEAGQNKIQQILDRQISKNPGTVRIGRDPLRCDIVLTDPTVSGLHVEIFFHSQQQNFYIRNLRSTNPPYIDGKQLTQGELILSQGSVIYLGQQKLQVTAVSVDHIAATVLSTPPVAARQPQPQVNVATPQSGKIPITQRQQVYGLECPKCHKVCPVENLQIGCPWCGTSLAAAVSVLVAPNN